ncbi:MAG: O-antigen ligase family protein [Acidobacteriia bacterium]|nr:O-antigen ligase family protein [Terriglobia bacterium]
MHFGLEGAMPLFLYLAAIAAFLASVFWRPEIGIYFIVPFFPLQEIRYRIIQYPLGNKLIDIILLGVILGILFRKDFRFLSRNPLNKPLFILCIFLYVSLWQGWMFLGGDMPLSPEDPRFSAWKNYMVMPLAFILVVSVIKDVKQMKILIVLMCLSALVADRSINTNIGGHDLSHFTYTMREGGVFGYAGANGAGTFAGQFALVLLGLCAYEKRKVVRLAALALAGFTTYCLMLTFSRGAYAGFLVGVTFLALLKERKILVLLIPFLLTWQAIVPASVHERVTTTYNESSSELEPSAADRVTLWEDAADLVTHYPLLGTGFNTYGYMHRVSEYRDTHNYFLKVLVETGIAGLLLFLWVVFGMWAVTYRLFRTGSDPFLKSLGLGLVTALACCLINNLFGDRWTYIEEAGFLWVLLGCVVRGLMLTKQASEQEKEPMYEAAALEALP